MNPDNDHSIRYGFIIAIMFFSILGSIMVYLTINCSPETIALNQTLVKNNTVINQEIYTYNYTLVQHEYKPIQVFYPRDKHKCSRHAWQETITGQSMLQAFPVNDQGLSYAYIDRVLWYDIRLGDIILFNKDSNKIVHAVVYKNEYYLETAGYNNVYKDDWRVEQHEVIGRVCENDY